VSLAHVWRGGLVLSGALAATSACAFQPTLIAIPDRPAVAARGAIFRTPVRHVVIIVQENRTPDYLFQNVPGADIAKTAINRNGKVVDLEPMSLAAAYDLDHGHDAFVRDFDGGKMDGFDKNLNRTQQRGGGPFRYAPPDQVKPYHEMAVQYVFADRMFQSDQAGSFPSHQYLVSGTSSALPLTSFDVSSDPFDKYTLEKSDAGCDAPKNTVVETINPEDGKPGPEPFPCFDRPVLSDLLDRRHVSWRYYQNHLGAGLWHALDAIAHVRYGGDYANVVTPPETILSDVKNGLLPGVSWVMPADAKHSDHAKSLSAAGPSWVAAVVNTIGQSGYWDSTAILITWDDWGGWYDHVPPHQYGNSFELGFRVPLVIVSAYAKQGYVSHVHHEFGSLLAFCERVFGIRKGALHSTDARADDLTDAFDFKRQPRAFVHIRAHRFVPAHDEGSLGDDEDP
jgi:phospholipase C